MEKGNDFSIYCRLDFLPLNGNFSSARLTEINRKLGFAVPSKKTLSNRAREKVTIVKISTPKKCQPKCTITKP
jgi:hypothetical protein